MTVSDRAQINIDYDRNIIQWLLFSFQTYLDRPWFMIEEIGFRKYDIANILPIFAKMNNLCDVKWRKRAHVSHQRRAAEFTVMKLRGKSIQL
jgi:hypothetical protein